MPQIKYSKNRTQNGEICMTPEREAANLAEVKLANVSSLLWCVQTRKR